MSRSVVVACGFVASLISAASLSYGQDAQLACGPDDLGVRNGTFDCDGTGEEWRYYAPQTAQNNGVIAEIGPHSARASNVLSLTMTSLPVIPNGRHPVKVLWQEAIRFPDAPARQLVLRFDHRIVQPIAFEQAVIIEFSSIETCSTEPDSTSSSLKISSMTPAEAAADEHGGWMSSEVYLDLPELVECASCVECDIVFKMTKVETCENERLSAQMLLDNIEIRVVEEPLDLEDGQPLECTLNFCGIAFETNFPTYVTEQAVARVAGTALQDDRRFQRRCTEVVCCPDNENFRESASTYLQSYDPPASTWLGTAVCPADLTGDGRVGGEDLPLVLARWGQQVECEAVDLKKDGLIDGQDLAILLAQWGPCR